LVQFFNRESLHPILKVKISLRATIFSSIDNSIITTHDKRHFESCLIIHIDGTSMIDCNATETQTTVISISVSSRCNPGWSTGRALHFINWRPKDRYCIKFQKDCRDTWPSVQHFLRYNPKMGFSKFTKISLSCAGNVSKFQNWFCYESDCACDIQ